MKIISYDIHDGYVDKDDQRTKFIGIQLIIFLYSIIGKRNFILPIQALSSHWSHQLIGLIHANCPLKCFEDKGWNRAMRSEERTEENNERMKMKTSVAVRERSTHRFYECCQQQLVPAIYEWTLSLIPRCSYVWASV